MLISNQASERARWQVLWIKDGRKITKDFEHDLTGALEVYVKVKGRRPGATLRCTNMGFPPPEELLPRIVIVRKPLAKPKIVRRGGKRYRKTHERVRARLVPMKKKNAEGVFWCPYCRELRRFKLKKKFKIEGVWLHEERMVCPMCGVSTRDHNVRRWNPIASRITYDLDNRRRRAPKRTVATRRRRRRRRKEASE